MLEKIKEKKAITLITLVITIILLIILAGVVINMTLGKNGLIKRTKEAKLNYEEQAVKETIERLILQMQMEEIQKGEELDLKKIAQTIENKDTNITLEYVEANGELIGTYKLNGEEYSFKINEKLKVEVIGKAKENEIKIQNIIWQNGKPQVTLTSNKEGTIEYKDSDGNWQTFGNEVQLENNTELIVRVKLPTGETTKEEKLQIKDKTKPTEFQIEVTSNNVQAKAVTVTLKTQPQDNETGMKEGYTYIVETNGNKIENKNITDTTYKITQLEPETNYTVYVIAYDNAGNYRESNKIKIRTLAYIPPTTNEPNNESTIRKGNELPFTWAQLSEISGIIENTLKDNNPNNDITNDTNEFTLNYEGTPYTIGVGDWKYVNYEGSDYKVRIMGFNHDILAGQNILNEDGTLKEEYLDTTNSNNKISEEGYNKLNKAGISFEFQDCIMQSDMYDMDKNTTNVGGWETRRIRKVLNEEKEVDETLNPLTQIRQYIKKVTKPYGKSYKSYYISYVEDELWLLSCIELLGALPNDGTRNIEGTQYKFYKNYIEANKTADLRQEIIKKINGTRTNWWLRTASGNLQAYYSYRFQIIQANGVIAESNMSSSVGIAPSFCI